VNVPHLNPARQAGVVENSSHRKIIPTHSSIRVRVKIKDRVKFMVRVRVRSRVKIKVKIRAKVEVRVRVSVSYIMTIWMWEGFFRCDKFPTTPVFDLTTPEGR